MKRAHVRLGASILACALALSLVGCRPTESKSAGGQQSSAGEGKLFTEPTELSIVVSSHVSWPFNENWVIWKYIEEATGASLKISALPSSDQETKIALMMADKGTLPDLLHTWMKTTVDKYALSGAFLSCTDNMDKMPNFQAFLQSLTEVERDELLMQSTSGDGKIYAPPSYGTQTVNNLRSWMYRKDVFDKHNLKMPETAEELYQSAKKLKELYPDSYPICFRTGILKLEEWGPSWQNDFTYQPYYDFAEKVWKYGVQEPVMKEMIEYFLKLKNENLVPPDYTTMETKSWEELMSTDRGFVTLDYVVRIDFFNLANRVENPGYNLALMPPPKADTPTGSQKLMKSNLNFNGYCVCNTGNKKNQDNAIRFVDWMYSDEAAELLSWGKKGETYEEDANGKKKFILKEGEQPQNAYGIASYGAYQRMLTEANEALYTDEQVQACHELLTYLEPRANPTMWLSFSEEDENRALALKVELDTYVQENLSKFLLGQRPMSEWDAFCEQFKAMGVEEYLEILTRTYNQIIENRK